MKTGVKAIVFVALILLVVGTSLGRIMDHWRTLPHDMEVYLRGGEHITIDDKQAYIVLQHSGVLIAIEGSTNGFASGVWAYAIHLGMQRIVAHRWMLLALLIIPSYKRSKLDQSTYPAGEMGGEVWPFLRAPAPNHGVPESIQRIHEWLWKKSRKSQNQLAGNSR